MKEMDQSVLKRVRYSNSKHGYVFRCDTPAAAKSLYECIHLNKDKLVAKYPQTGTMHYYLDFGLSIFGLI